MLCHFHHYRYSNSIMFVQRPATSHVPRHYTAKRTGGKNVDKENAGALPSKTPSKGVLKGGMLVPNTAKPLGKARGDEKGKGKEDDIGKYPSRLASDIIFYCMTLTWTVTDNSPKEIVCKYEPKPIRQTI